MKNEYLYKAFEDIDWDNFQDICENLTKINEDKIDLELIFSPSVYSSYLSLLCEAKKQYDLAVLEFDVFVAKGKQDIRLQKESLGKKVTDKYVEEYITTLDGYKEKYIDKINKREKYDLLNGLCKCLNERHTNLVQLSATKRAETKLY